MNLKVYLVIRKISIAEFARSLDYTVAHISRVIHGVTKASKRLAKTIEIATNGEINREYILGLYKKIQD